MYATVFLILVRQRRRARAALTLCAQCWHKYAIYASVWPYPCLRDRTCESEKVHVPEGKDVLVDSHTWSCASNPPRVCILWWNVVLRFLVAALCSPASPLRSNPLVFSRGFFSCSEAAMLFLFIPNLQLGYNRASLTSIFSASIAVIYGLCW